MEITMKKKILLLFLGLLFLPEMCFAERKKAPIQYFIGYRRKQVEVKSDVLKGLTGKEITGTTGLHELVFDMEFAGSAKVLVTGYVGDKYEKSTLKFADGETFKNYNPPGLSYTNYNGYTDLAGMRLDLIFRIINIKPLGLSLRLGPSLDMYTPTYNVSLNNIRQNALPGIPAKYTRSDNGEIYQSLKMDYVGGVANLIFMTKGGNLLVQGEVGYYKNLGLLSGFSAAQSADFMIYDPAWLTADLSEPKIKSTSQMLMNVNVRYVLFGFLGLEAGMELKINPYKTEGSFMQNDVTDKRKMIYGGVSIILR